MVQFSKRWIIVIAFICIFGNYANAHIVKRQSDNESDDSSGDSTGDTNDDINNTNSTEDSGGLSGLIITVSEVSRSIPLVGTYIGGAIDGTSRIWAGIQDATDGAVGRILGGAFPCTLSLEVGLVCTGDTVNSKLGDLVATVLHPIPSIILPEFVKSFIVFILDFLGEPLLDILFGGIPLPNAQAI